MLFGYKILVFCTSQIHQSRFSDFICSLNERLKENNWRVFVFCTDSNLSAQNRNTQGERNIFELINYDIADALLISEGHIHDKLVKTKLIAKANAHNIPTIIFEGNNPNTYNIRFSQKNGFEALVNHLIKDHGINKIHFMAGAKGSVQSDERLDLLIKILEENKIKFNPDTMVSYGDFWDGPTKVATQKLIDKGNIPDAMICANDTMAIAALSVFKKNGYECPKDIIITGFDGIQEIYFSNPTITSCICDYKKLGAETADFVVSINKNPGNPYTKYVDATLVTAESCGCKLQSNVDSLEYITYLNNSYNRFRAEDTSLNNMSVLVHDCKSIEDVIGAINNGLLYNCFVCLKSECLDENTDPNITHSSSTYGNAMYVMLDSDSYSQSSCHYIKTANLIPRMEEMLDRYQMPLIFAPINNIDLPLGYICFCFMAYERQNYTKVSQISNWLGNAFAGYRNMQYQRHLQKKIENLYQHDPLTNLLNRNGFSRIYNKVLEDTNIKTISLAMCDLDNLKLINDNYSHNEGDEAIRVVASAISDAIPDGYFCRYGGDEILGLYPYSVDEKALKKNIQDFIDKYNKVSGKDYEVSTSIGIYTSKKTTFEEMFGKADKLMYEQKMNKKNRRK